MVRMFLVIKGTEGQAMAQAHARGIALEVDGVSNSGTEVYAYAPMIDRAKIIDWYCEDRGFAEVAQAGECLWYAEREDV